MGKWVRYRILLMKNNKQKKILYDMTNFSGITEIYHELIENNNTILPQKYVNSNGITPVKHQLVLVKTKEESDKNRIVRNELGKLVEEVVESDKWVVLERDDYEIEETFWVYGYHSRFERFSTTDIIKNILLKDIRKKNMVKTIRVVHNKVVIQSDYDDFNMIICKCEEDASRLYYTLLEASKMTSIKRLLFMGFATDQESVSQMYDIILENTDWSIEKIRRLSTRP